MNLFTQLSAKQLRQAAALKEQIDGLQAQLNEILGLSLVAQDGEVPRRKRKMSRAGRAAIAAAARARWARVKGTKPSQSTKPKRKMSAAAKARLSAIAKARWRKAKAAGKARL